jgi:hypothetical protein
MSITRAQIATQLLNEMAPKGEKLAYINNREAELLKRMGGAGVDINKTGIKSYFDPGSGRGSVSESLSQAAFGSSGPTFSSDGGGGGFTPIGNFATITKDEGGLKTAPKMFNLQKHFDQNQLLKDAVGAGTITEEEYNILGGYDVQRTMGLNSPVLGALGNLVGSLVYNAVQSIRDGQPVVEGLKDVGRNIMGGAGLFSPTLKNQYENIIAQGKARGGRVNYANGGRSRYGLGKLVKKITQPAKKLIKSDLGKAALTAAAIYTLGGGGNPFTAAGRGKFATMNIPGYLKAKNYLIGTSANTSYPGTRGLLNRLGITKLGGSLGLTGKGLAGLGILGASAAAGLSAADQEDDENLDEAIARVYGKSDLDIPGIRKAALGYSDPNELYFQLPSAFRSKVANGGIMTLTREEEEQKDINEDSLLNKAKAIAKKEGISVEEALKKIMEYNFEQDITYSGKAEGGLMNLGGNEMDLRGGGFVPIGAKEKADDVPARLSKNEFVFTADAVRAAGGGSIEKGAQKMYNTMKQLENII